MPAPIGVGTNEPLNVKVRRLSKTTGPPIDAILPLSAESRLAGTMQLKTGSATVPVALFGVSPNKWCSRFHSPSGALVSWGERWRPVGGTPTGAVETTALPVS